MYNTFVYIREFDKFIIIHPLHNFLNDGPDYSDIL